MLEDYVIEALTLYNDSIYLSIYLTSYIPCLQNI